MSVAGIDSHRRQRTVGLLDRGVIDALEPLTSSDRREVRDLLDLIARRLALRSGGLRQYRGRLDAIIAALIGIADALDGDADLEQTATESRGLGFACDASIEDAE